MQFRKKPVVVEAVQLTSAMLDGIESLPGGVFRNSERNFGVVTLEGVMTGNAGDWLITGVKGEKYICRRDIFEQTYERVLV
jgi:hypothetical protein